VYLKALADPLRLRIVEYLGRGTKTVSDVAEHLGVELANASHHLHVMLHARLVKSRRDGRHVRYFVNPKLLSAEADGGDVLEFGCCRIEFGRVQARRSVHAKREAVRESHAQH